MDIGINKDNEVAELSYFIWDSNMENQRDFSDVDGYSAYVKGGGKPCFLNEKNKFKIMAVVTRIINGKFIHIGAWKGMRLQGGDRIKALWLGIAIKPLSGGLIYLTPRSPEAIISPSGDVNFIGIEKNWVPEFWISGPAVNWMKDDRPLTIPKYGGGALKG